LQALRRAMHDVETALPMLGEPLRVLIGRIEALHRHLPAGAETPVHGNLFGDQILITAYRVGFVDWDDLCRGDPLFDLGRLIAHLIYLADERGLDTAYMAPRLAALVRGCAGAMTSKAMWTRLRWQIAVALLMRAKISALRPLGPDWVERIAAMAHEAGRVLDDRSPWLRR
jgi:aminoglycoside phosphotransferase (APT) family kinase protein